DEGKFRHNAKGTARTAKVMIRISHCYQMIFTT
ncbi:MAG: hypothetical protein ACJAWZ_002853, partial [Paracoccaceae bacterium]